MSDKPFEAGFGHDASVNDELFSNPQLKDLKLVPDPPATLVCDICKHEETKSGDNLSKWHCGQPMRDEQRHKSTDEDLLKKILEYGRRHRL